MSKAFHINANRYNLRSRDVIFVPGQTVFRRSFCLSNKAEKFNAKLANQFVKAKIVRAIGNTQYELEDLHGKSIGVFHTKDIRV